MICYRCGYSGHPLRCNCANTMQRRLDQARHLIRAGEPLKALKEVEAARLAFAELRGEQRSPWTSGGEGKPRRRRGKRAARGGKMAA